MKERAIKTLFEGKKQRLTKTLDWIEENCNKQQKDEVNQIIDQYADYLVAFPHTDYLRSSHALDSIATPPTEEELNQLPREKALTNLEEEIDSRKQLINGLIMELEELKELRGKLEK